MMDRLMYTTGAIATFLALAMTGHAQAQDAGSRLGLSVVGGASSYDLSGVGTAAVVAVRAEIPALRRFVVEPGLGYFRYADQSGTTTAYLLPEVSLQFVPLQGALRPYLGVGGGGAAVLTGGSGSELSLHAAAGLRVRLTSVWALMGEFRVRTIDPLHGTTADYTGGVSLRL